MDAPTTGSGDAPIISEVRCRVYTVPTDQPEADGTLAWSSTTVVTVEVRAGDVTGLGWTYASSACKAIVDEVVCDVLVGRVCLGISGLHETMVRGCRNIGRPGVAACAISATDIALWDLKARLLDVTLGDLFGRCRASVPVYGSGGFITYDDATATEQLEHWTERFGLSRVKIKIGESWGTKERVMSPVWRMRAGSSVTTSSCTSMRTVATRANKACAWVATSSMNSPSRGSRSPSPPMISKDARSPRPGAL